MKRAVCYQQFCNNTAYRELLACSADVVMDELLVNVGQKDLATVLAVWSDNFSEEHYIGKTLASKLLRYAGGLREIKTIGNYTKTIERFFSL